MKAKTRKAMKRDRRAQHHGGATAMNSGGPASRRRFRLPRWAVILLTVAAVAGVSFAAFELLLPGRIPLELVGQWRVVGGDMDGMTLEFQRDGTMIGRVTVNGNDNLMKGMAEVDGNILRTTTTNPFTRKAETGMQTIVTLTETQFVTEDKKGTRITMARVR
jgi:uncharacterized protein (TIGR03066 family)